MPSQPPAAAAGSELVCHSQGGSRDEALLNIREAIQLWLEVEAEEAGVKTAEVVEFTV